MGVTRKLVGRALPQIDKRIDWRVERKLEEQTRQGEAIAEMKAEMAGMSEKLLFTMSELRRWMIDDLEAANETTMFLGESLTRLAASLDRLEGDVGAVSERLAVLERAQVEAGRT